MADSGLNPVDVEAVQAAQEAARQADLAAAEQRAQATTAAADMQAIADADPLTIAADPATHIQTTARAVRLALAMLRRETT
jgi:hypothetical protein